MSRELNRRLIRIVAPLAAALLLALPAHAQETTQPTATPEPPPNCPAFEGQPADQRVAYYMGEGTAYLAASRYAEAELAFTCVIRVIDASYVPAYMGRGEIYLRTRELEDAIADFTRADQLNAAVPFARNNRGVAYALLGDEERAAADFDAALGVDANYLQAINNRALLYTIAGDYEAAIALISGAIDVTNIDQTLAEIRNPDRRQDAPRLTVLPQQANLYGLLGTIRSAQALADYRAYLELVNYAGTGVDERIGAAASALESRFSFDFRLDDGSLLQISRFPQTN